MPLLTLNVGLRIVEHVEGFPIPEVSSMYETALVYGIRHKLSSGKIRGEPRNNL